MSYSHNEIANLAAKAARGSGAPVAQAAAFGRAVVRHLAAGRSEEALLAALCELPNGPILDLAIKASVKSSNGMARVALGETLEQSYLDASDDVGPIAQRVSPSEDLIQEFQDRARRTYIPESATSRQSGAGAGDIDND